MQSDIELTILMPCLNESETLAKCIKKAQTFLQENGIVGEILIADNGSIDGSQDIAKSLGVRVENVPIRGYGAALIHGNLAARGKYVIMGDADDSYDFLHLMPFMDKLREGFDLVMGNRFAGGIEKGAMPPLHKYLGNPVLSFIGRLFFPSNIGDFHCGLRGYRRDAVLGLHLHTTGMEYASEMVVQATLQGLKTIEVPTTLKKDGRSRPPHLRSWSDGWRHLKFLLIHSPNWLFLYPGYFFFFIGLIFFVMLAFGSIVISGVHFDINTLLYAAMAILLGINLILFAVYTRTYAEVTGFLSMSRQTKFLSNFTANRGVPIGAVVFAFGLLLMIFALLMWKQNAFSEMDTAVLTRLTIPSMLFMVSGLQLIFGGFFVDILRIKTKVEGSM